ncbi:hypothetical protein MUU72_02050 [Streptomyces sp. RS10V-4]|uniref:hypothetical protein n=1 Tax=Streptomyces rhizoryzae TaxID=2932493 RepID=UPI0020060BB6|nr:hypothetical protein [Streptomyces rhizoryzae]MCK7621918.1 hypothetical protein [Streptomyces rhizoryzae]
MAADELARTVREQVGTGRILPLGGPADGAWITERAARAALLRAPDIPPGVRLDALRLALADPGGAPEPAVPAPPGALPPGPLRLTAAFAAPPGHPLPALAGRLRAALLTAAEEGLGLVVSAADLRVTDLLDAPAAPVPATGTTGTPSAAPAPPPPAAPYGAPAAPGGPAPDSPDEPAAQVLAVPGVARLAPVSPTGRSRAVVRSGGHVLVQLATAPGHRPLDVARAVRLALAAPPTATATAAVLVTAVADG